MGVDSVPLIGESLLLMNECLSLFKSIIVLESDVCFVFLMEFVVHNNGEMILFYSAAREFSFLGRTVSKAARSVPFPPWCGKLLEVNG